MSFLVKSPNLSAAATAQQQVASYKEAEPVPFGYGSAMLPAHWLSDSYGWREVGAGSNKPNYQYCSIAFALGEGPIDYVGLMKQDGKPMWNFDYWFADGENYHDFTINASMSGGLSWTCRIYRGTEAQTPDAGLCAGTGQDHPAYRGTAYAVMVNIDLGMGNTTIPTFSIETGRNPPQIGDGVLSGDAGGYGANPFAAIYGMLLDASAGDFDASLLDEAHWAAQVNALCTTGVQTRSGERVFCHPWFRQATKLGDAISQILAYVDGYVYAQGGKLRVGWFPGGAPAAELPTIEEKDLKAGTRPSGSGFPDWNQSATSTVVVFTDKDGRQYEDGAAVYNAPANRETGIASSPQRKDRPFVHFADQAAQFASELSAAEVSDTSLNLEVLKRRANRADGSPLMPGDLFRWIYSPHGLSLVCRVVSRRLGVGQASDVLQVVRERGAFPAPYAGEPDEREPYVPVMPVDVANYRLWFLPPGFGGGRQITLLAEQPAAQNIATRLHLSATGSAPWTELLTVSNFAARGTLTLAAGAGDATVRLSSTSINLAAFQAQSAIDQKDDTLLLLIGDEVLSVGAITAIGGGVLELGVLRGRQGSAAASYSVGAVAWLFYAAELYTVTHEEFYDVRVSGTYNTSRATKRFKLQAVSADGSNDPAPADPGIAFQFPDLSESDSTGARTFRGPNPPTGLLRVGDLWYDTDDGNRLYRWNGSAWADTSDARHNTAATSIAAIQAMTDALVVEANTVASDLLDEIAAREGAIASEVTARESADSSMLSMLDALSDEYYGNKAVVASQISTLITENSSQASSLTTLFSTTGTHTSQISSLSTALASEESTRASQVSTLTASIGGVSAEVDVIQAAYIIGGAAVATWGFKLDAFGKVVGMQAIAASGGVQDELGVIIFSGADLRTDNYVAGSTGWFLGYDGSVDIAEGLIRCGLRIGTNSTTPGYSGNTDEGFAVEPGSNAIFASRGGNFALSLNRNSSNGATAIFHRGGTQVGEIQVTGTSTSYVTSSDQRLKNDLGEFNLADVASPLWDLPLRKFRWHAWEQSPDPAEQARVAYGVFAQEAAQVCPWMAHYNAETDRWGVSWDALMPNVIAALKVHRAELHDLRTRLAALEAA